MPRMLDLIRASAVPPNLVESAARGALSLPPLEMVEILVYLATGDKDLGEQARATLAHWDEETVQAIAADPHTPEQILVYLADPQNFRSALLPALLANPSVSEGVLARLAAAVSWKDAEVIFASSRAESPAIQEALNANPNLSKNHQAAAESMSPSSSEGDDVLDEELTAYLTEHAAEIAAEEKPFQPIGGMHEEILAAEPAVKAAAAGGNGGVSTEVKKSIAAKKNHADEQRGSALQKISRLDVKGRIQLGMKGSKEERSILVRDGTKVVALAVLDSPKVTEAEVEMFASQKNVLEALLRGITMKRRFMKNYNIVRNLTCNPRTPLDVSLGLMKNLHIGDLKNLSANKDVSETIRKLALKMYRQKRDPSKKDV